MTGSIRLLRPLNLLILILAIWFARVLAGGATDPLTLFAATAAAALLAGAFYVWNDVSDLEVDRVNRPDRPLPSGTVAVGAAKAFGAGLVVMAFLAGLLAGAGVLLVLFLWFLMLVAYETGVKKKGIAGNLFVSVVASSPLLYGAWLGGSVAAGVIPALFAFLLHLAREIVKDIGDVPGDGRAGRETIPIRIGERNAFLLSAFPLLFLVLFTPIPFLLGVYDVRYLLAVLLGVDVVLLVVLAGCYFRPDRWRMALLSRVLKGEMVIAMIAILVGSAR